MKLKLSNFIQSVIDEVNKELEQNRIIFRPRYYVSNEWGCPNKVPIIAVPYSFCYPVFTTFEEDGIVVNRDLVLKIVRHEVGHAINYAYKFYKRSDWERIFGKFNKPYKFKEAAKRIDPFSKDFVSNLPDFDYCHAQIHPDEDFAETFAVWLGESSEWWEDKYLGRKSFKKLLYINKLMYEIKNRPPLVIDGKEHKPYFNLILKGR
jgi:hypothetical protein